jgi:GNAT superfamily N-acetyltransferase
MEIREYSSTHLRDCADLFVRVFNSPPWNDRWTTEKARALLAGFANTPGFMGFVGIIDDRIVGACFGRKRTWWNREEYHVEEMFVGQEHQRTGLGSELLKGAEEALKRKDISALTLLTGRATYAKDFYLKNGFHVVDKVVFMAKSI